MDAKTDISTYWVHEPISGQAWRIVPHNAEMTRFMELGIRAHYYERMENPQNAKPVPLRLSGQRPTNVVSMVAFRRKMS